MLSNKQYDYLFKFTLLGMNGAGKTSFIDRYVEDIFHQETWPVKGIDFRIKIIDIENKHIKLQLWEPEPCCRRGEHIPYSYEIRGAHGLIFIYDLTDKESFTFIQNIINKYKLIDKKMLKHVFKILVGNKYDKSGKCVSEEDVRNLCNENNMVFFEASAKNNINVNNVFELMTRRVLDNINKNHSYTKGLSLYRSNQNIKHYC